MFHKHSASPPEEERDLLARAADWLAGGPRAVVTEETLRQLAERQGVDFATAVLYQTLRTSERHGPLIAALDAPAADSPRLDADLVIVPGAFYREAPHTGADGALVRQAGLELGCRVETAPLASFGSVRGNADHLARWLRQRGARPLVLVSLSKGTTEVRQALGRPDAFEVFRSIVAWIDLSGLYHGTPLVSWLRARRLRWWMIHLLFWIKGYTFSALEEIDRPACSERAAALPGWRGETPILHVVGLPLQRHLTTPLARRGHRRLSPFGPNDGTIVLADVLALPGRVYPVWGADHYLRPSGGDLRSLAARILKYLASERQSSAANQRR